MKWFNLFGLIFMVILMIPNLIYSIRNKEAFENHFENKTLLIFEQIGRYGCFAFMIINIPKTAFGFWSDEAFAVYLIVNSILLLLYCIAWIIFRKNSVSRALILSILPSAIFLFSGIMSCAVLLIISALIFAPCHIAVSYKNAVLI